MASALTSAYSSPRPEPYSMSAAQDRQLAGSPSITGTKGQKLRAAGRGPRSTPRPPLQPNALQARYPVRSPYSVQVAPLDRARHAGRPAGALHPLTTERRHAPTTPSQREF